MEDFDRIEEIGTRTSTSIAIAIEGCCHGQLTAIYDRLRKFEEDETDTIEELSISTNEHDQKLESTETNPQRQPKSNKKKIDLLICCGDFQSIRTPADFHSLAVPAKYREMGSFYKYYNEEWEAPVLTIFCGGNHEASQPLSELYYGGWVAPKMYYLGAAGVIRYKGIRIGGLSGIYKSHDYYQSRNEIPPYDTKQLRSVYHYRNVDVYRLSCLKPNDTETMQIKSDPVVRTTGDTFQQKCQADQPSRRLDIMISHDWPQGVEQYGDVHDLIRRKPFFRQEINDDALGSPPAAHLLHTLQPSYWFAAHLHVKFHAKIVHGTRSATSDNAIISSRPPPSSDTAQRNLIPSQVIQAKMANFIPTKQKSSQFAEDITDHSIPTNIYENNGSDTGFNNVISDTAMPTPTTTHFVIPESSLNSLSCPNSIPDLTQLMTQFLSLDKCLPRRQYLSILHLPIDPMCDKNRNNENVASHESKLEYDLEWLAIIRKTHHLAASTYPHRFHLPEMSHKNDGIQKPSHQVTDADIAWIRERIGNDMTIPENFYPTITRKYYGQNSHVVPPPLYRMGNPQTDQLLELLQLEHLPNLTIPYSKDHEQQQPYPSGLGQNPNSADQVEMAENEIELDNNNDTTVQSAAVSFVDKDENEIDLDENDDTIPLEDDLHQITTSVLEISNEIGSNTRSDVKRPRLDGE
jgi:lariat debranching enzyme